MELDIVKELRTWEGEYHYPSGLLLRAADQIEQLRVEVRILSKALEQRPLRIIGELD